MSMNSVFVQATDDEIRLLLATPREIIAFLRTRDSRTNTRVLHIDKDWQALHWLLTGTEWEGDPPLNFIIMGGTEIGDIDVGYGAARAFTSVQTREIHEALAQISTVTLLSRYNAQAMSDLYPGVWDRPDEQAINRADLAFTYDNLKRFIAQAVSQQLGLITYVY